MGIFMSLVWGPVLIACLSFIMSLEVKGLKHKIKEGQSVKEDIASLSLSALLGTVFMVLFIGGF